MVDESRRLQVITSLWRKLCQAELSNVSTPDRGLCLALGLISPHAVEDRSIVPIDFIVCELEKCSAKCKMNPEWVLEHLTHAGGIGIVYLLPAYENFVSCASGSAVGHSDYSDWRFSEERVVDVTINCLRGFCSSTVHRTNNQATGAALRIVKHLLKHYHTAQHENELRMIQIELERRFALR
ncbi:hypothetical protein ACOME3_000253 [Neoechinorhynchus agilis]